MGLCGCAEAGACVLAVRCGAGRDSDGRDGACGLAAGAASGATGDATGDATSDDTGDVGACVTTLAMMTWSVVPTGVGVVNQPWLTSQITPTWASTTAPVTRHVALWLGFRRRSAWGGLRSGRLGGRWGGRWDSGGCMANRGSAGAKSVCRVSRQVQGLIRGKFGPVGRSVSGRGWGIRVWRSASAFTRGVATTHAAG